MTRFTQTLLLSLCVLFALPAQDTFMCDNRDYPGLMALYDATDGDNWRNTTGRADWFTNCDPCTWAGIGCDEDGRVTDLNLRGVGLAGELPAELATVDRLRNLNFGYNELTGPLPTELFTLDSLREAILSGNQLTGSVPATLAQATRVEKVLLDGNDLTGSLPEDLSGLTDLTFFDVAGNQLSGSLPAGLGDLPAIFYLNFSNNDFAGCFPEDLSTYCGYDRVFFGGNPKLSWNGDFSEFCTNGFDEEQVGAPCDDGNPLTAGDAIGLDCGCSGSLDPDNVADGGLIDLGEVPTENIQNRVAGLTPGITGQIPPVGGLAAPATDLSVFPNPATGTSVRVNLPQEMTDAVVRLTDLNGRVLTQLTPGTTDLDLPALQPGIYLVEAANATRRAVTRVVIQ